VIGGWAPTEKNHGTADLSKKISLQNKVVTTKPTQKLNLNQNPRSKYAPARHDHQTKSHATQDGAQQFASYKDFAGGSWMENGEIDSVRRNRIGRWCR